MDGDLQHPPRYIKKLLKVFFKNKADVVIGSRNLFKKRGPGLNFFRYISSLFIIYIINFLLNINNFWLPFLEIIQHLKKNKMIRDSDDKFIEARSLKNLYVANSIEDIFSHPQFI